MTIDEKKHGKYINGRKKNVLNENYPELKSSENYNTLQKSIADVEEHLQASRRLYNANVSNYNQKIVTFPSNVIFNIKCCHDSSSV